MVLFAALLVTMVGLVYWQVASHDFVDWDDNRYVGENYWVLQGLTLQTVAQAFVTVELANWHPLTWLSHALDVEIWGADPGGHHITNVLFHMTNSLLLFVFLSQATQSFWRSALVAFLFALHPMNVEVVAWVSERKELLSSFFGFSALIVYLRYTQRRALWKYLASLVLFAASLMAKPMWVTFPFLLLLVDFWPLERMHAGRRGAAPLAGLLLEKLPFLALAFISSAVTYLAQQAGHAMHTVGDVGLAVRIGNAVVSYATYLLKTFVPHGLAFFYPYDTALDSSSILLSFLALAALAYLAWQLRSRCPAVTVGYLWFLGTLVPVIGLVQVGDQAMADRYGYLPLVGVFVAVVWGVAWALSGRAPALRRVFGALAVSIVLALAWASWQQTGYWKDSETLFRRAIAVTESNYLAYTKLALQLAKSGDLDGASNAIERAIEARPFYHRAYLVRGHIESERGDLRAARASVNAAMRLSGGDRSVLLSEASLAERAGDYQLAIAAYRRILQSSPDDETALTNIASACEVSGQLDQAVEVLNRAQSLYPLNPRLSIIQGNIHRKRGDVQQARRSYMRALELDPRDVVAHYNLGILAHEQQQRERSIAHYKAALAIDPGHIDSLNNLGVVLLQSGEYQDAIRYLRAAVELDNAALGSRYNLATAYLRVGQPGLAESQLRAIQAIDPDYRWTSQLLGQALSAQGRTE